MGFHAPTKTSSLPSRVPTDKAVRNPIIEALPDPVKQRIQLSGKLALKSGLARAMELSGPWHDTKE